MPEAWEWSNCFANALWFLRRLITRPNLDAVIRNRLSSSHHLHSLCVLVSSSTFTTWSGEYFKKDKNFNPAVAMHLQLTGCGCLASSLTTVSLVSDGDSDGSGRGRRWRKAISLLVSLSLSLSDKISASEVDVRSVGHDCIRCLLRHTRTWQKQCRQCHKRRAYACVVDSTSADWKCTILVSCLLWT